MPETAQELQFEFTDKGLKSLLRKMEEVTSATGGLGDAASGAADTFSGAVDQMEKDAERLQKVAEAQSEAMGKAYQGSTQQVDALAEALVKAQRDAQALDGTGINVEAQGSESGGALINALRGGASLAQLGVATAQLVQMKEAVEGLGETARLTNRFLDNFQGTIKGAANAPGTLANGIRTARQGLADFKVEAMDAKDAIGRLFDRMRGADTGGESLNTPIRQMQQELPILEGRPAQLQEQADAYESVGEAAKSSTADVRSFVDDLRNSESAGEAAGVAFTGAGTAVTSLRGAMSAAVGTMGKAAAGVAGLTAAVVALNAKMAQLAFRWDQYAQQIKVAEAQSGIAADTLQETFFIAKRLDSEVSFDTIRDGMKELAIRTTEAMEGTGEAREAFDRLGISMDELSKRSDDAGEQLELILGRMEGLTRQQRITSLEQIFGGEGGERFARLAGLSAERLGELRQEYQALTLSGRLIDDMDELQQETTELGQTWDAVGQKLGGLIADRLSHIVELLNDASGAILDLVNAGVRFDAWLEENNGRLDTFGGHFATLVESGLHGYLQQLAEAGFRFGYAIGQGESATQAMTKAIKGLREELDKLADAEPEDPVNTDAALSSADELGERYFQTKYNLDDDLSRGLIDEKEYYQELAKAQRRFAEGLRDLDYENDNLELSINVDRWFEQYKETVARIEAMSEGDPVELQAEIRAVQGASVQTPEMPDMNRDPGMLGDPLRGVDFSSFSIEQIRELAPSLDDIDTVLGSLDEQFQSAMGQEQRDRLKALIKEVERLKREYEGAGESLGMVAQSMASSLARAANTLTSGIGEVVGNAIFGGGGGQSVSQLRLQAYNLQAQERQLRESLARRQITYQEFQLRLQALTQQQAKQQQALAAATAGAWTKAFDTIGDVVKATMKQLIKDVTAAVSKVLLLRTLVNVLGVGTGGAGTFGTQIITQLGGGGLLSKTSSAAAAGPKMQQASLQINVGGSFGLDGRELTAGVEQEKAYNARIS